jgi:hypothetical protein
MICVTVPVTRLITETVLPALLVTYPKAGLAPRRSPIPHGLGPIPADMVDVTLGVAPRLITEIEFEARLAT